MKSSIQKGTVYWITGLSGAGKTTIGRLFYEQLLHRKQNVVFLDGDTMRELFNNDLGHSIEDRKKLAMFYSKLCRVLSDQGIDIVCATISMFHECQEWNKKNIKNFKEIYLRVPLDILKKRDQKELYSRALNQELKNVMGLDLKFEEPQRPDVVIDNDGTKAPTDIAKELFKKFCLSTVEKK